MSKQFKKLKLLGAFQKKYFTRSIHTTHLVDTTKIMNYKNTILCVDDNGDRLKHLQFFTDDLDELAQFLKEDQGKYQLSLLDSDYDVLKEKINFSQADKFSLYRLEDNINGVDFNSIKYIKEMKIEQYELIKEFSSFHQTDYGKQSVIKSIQANGVGYVAQDQSFLFVEDIPQYSERFGSTLYSMGKSTDVIKLLLKSIYDFRQTNLKNYYTLLDKNNEKTITIHEKIGFRFTDIRPSMYEVIT